MLKSGSLYLSFFGLAFIFSLSIGSGTSLPFLVDGSSILKADITWYG